MRPRDGSRDFAIVLFCIVAIVVLNDFSHNDYRGISNPVPTIMRAVKGTEVRRGFESMTLYALLDHYAADPMSVERLKGVAVLGQILREAPAEAIGKAEFVEETFRISRRFSPTGAEEDAHMISARVDYPNKDAGLEVGMWVLAQGQVRADPDSNPDRPRPMIEAVQVTVQRAPPHQVLTPQGEQDAPDHAGHSH